MDNIYCTYNKYFLILNTFEIAKINEKLSQLNENDMTEFYCNNLEELTALEEKFKDSMCYNKYVSSTYF